jgi:hypothetical protein
MTVTTIGGGSDEVRVPGNLRVGGTVNIAGATTGVARTNLTQDNLAVYPLELESWKVFDAIQTALPGTPSTDDLGVVGGTFGTGVPSLQTEDLKTAGATSNRARRTFVLPPEYVAAETVQIRLHAGMLTTVADTTATVDVEIFKSDREATVDGTDLVATAAQSCNSLTLADLTFTVTATSLAPGDILDIRITTTVTDAATGTAVKAIIGAVELLLDVKG